MALDCDIQIARDGVSARESIEAESPDLISLDILMPRMDGYELGRNEGDNFDNGINE